MLSSDTNSVYSELKTGRREIFFQFLVYILILFSIFMYGLHKIYGFAIYPDEFGYWSSAATAVGYDWKQVTALGSYYSFGYSLILYPILLLQKDPVTAYRVALSINVVLQIISIGLLWGILKRIFAGDIFGICNSNPIISTSAASIGVFYPVWIMHSQMTLVEALLTFLYVLICYLCVRFLEKPSVVTIVLLGGTLTYTYMVHMRTVGMIIGAIFVIALFTISNKSIRKYLLLLIGISAIGLIIFSLIKNKIDATVFSQSSAEHLAVNDYSGQINNLKKVLSLKGIGKLLISIIGKFFYLSVASFGLYLYCFITCVGAVIRIIKDIRSVTYRDWFRIFILVTMLGQVAITSITTVTPGRLDGYIYGRYNEYVLPVFMMMGFIDIWNSKHPMRLWRNSAMAIVGMMFIVVIAMTNSSLESMHEYFCAGISYLKMAGDYHRNVLLNISSNTLIGILVGLIAAICICVAKKDNRLSWCIYTVILAEVVLAFVLGNTYSYKFSDFCYQDVRMCESIEEVDIPVVYVYEDTRSPAIDWVQFVLRDRSIQVVNITDSEKETISSIRSRLDDELDEYYLLVNFDSKFEPELAKEKKLNILGRFSLYRF